MEQAKLISQDQLESKEKLKVGVFRRLGKQERRRRSLRRIVGAMENKQGGLGRRSICAKYEQRRGGVFEKEIGQGEHAVY